VAFLASYNPRLTSRGGNILYQTLVDDVLFLIFLRQPTNFDKSLCQQADGKWPWAASHPWQSWRNRYMKDQEYFDARITRHRKLHPTETEATPPAKLPSGPRRKAQADKTKKSKTSRRTVQRQLSESDDSEEEEVDELDEQAEVAPVGQVSVKREEDRAEMVQGSIVEQPKKEAVSIGGIHVPDEGSEDNKETVVMGLTGHSKVSDDVANEPLKDNGRGIRDEAELAPNLLEGQSNTRMNDENRPDEEIDAADERLDAIRLAYLVLRLIYLRQGA
jgi:hypothetical protein